MKIYNVINSKNTIVGSVDIRESAIIVTNMHFSNLFDSLTEVNEYIQKNNLVLAPIDPSKMEDNFEEKIYTY